MAKFFLLFFITYAFNRSTAENATVHSTDIYRKNVSITYERLNVTSNTEKIVESETTSVGQATPENTTCGENEIMNSCPSEKCEYCPTCDEDARACLSVVQDSCPPPKCTCRNNYRRLQNGTCIPTRECPSFHCPRSNEVFDPCPLCASDNCSRATPDGSCKVIARIGIPLQCRPSCRCRKNYWRDGERCVPYENCPNVQNNLKCNLPNECLKCVKQCPPLKTCKNRHIQVKCFNNETEICKHKCVCNNGFYRNEDGFCVIDSLCDKKCTGPNEVYTPDKKDCHPDICKSIVSRYACSPNEKGQPGCVCKSGYLRLNLNSTCIPMEQCPELANSPDHHKPKCNLPNESLKCLKRCPPPKTCNSRNLEVLCLHNETEICKDQCVCNNGFFRNKDGYCVTDSLCDKKCSGPNEIYKPNKTSCPPETCQSRFALYKCDSKEIPQPGCVCKPGYLRLNINSTCIPSEECPPSQNSTVNLKCSLPNESLQCVRSCPPLRTCENRNKTFHCPMFNSSTPCKNVCACNKGFYRNSDGFCVTSKLCDKICSDPNEEYKSNIKKCQKDLCSSIVSKFACDPKDEGQPGCFCKSGFLRLTQNSSCIPTKECPEIANSPDNQNKTCRENEIMNTCPSEKCEYCPTCDEDARACLSVVQDSCPPPKCTCRNNYRRLQNGTCIPTRECPSFHCPRSNEVFDPCPLCASDNCSRATPDGSCKVVGRIGIPLQCRPSCRCRKNYWRDGERCVPYESCPNVQNNLKCKLPNESLKCVKQCPPLKTCKNRHIQVRCFNNETEICKNKCVCNNGFYRNEDGYCVTDSLCDKQCSGPNEIYKPNKTSCPPQTCQSKLALYKCDSKEIPQPGCVCKPGYLRLNVNSSCIPSEECPPSQNSTANLKCSLPNESLQCVRSCPPLRTCENRNKTFFCPMFNSSTPCKNVCACNKGFYRNSDGFCVTSELCDKCTKPNESLKCVKSCPRPRTCIGRHIRYKCFNNTNEVCKNECVCDDGFYRNSDGFCVTSDLCDKKCLGLHEEYTPNRKSCSPDICHSLVTNYKCRPKDQGQPGCVCKTGFLRMTLNSPCIPKEDCPEFGTTPHSGGKCVDSDEDADGPYPADIEYWFIIDVPPGKQIGKDVPATP